MFHHMILDRPKKPGVIAQLCCAEGEVFPEAGHSAVVYRLAQRLDKQLLLLADAAADNDPLRVKKYGSGQSVRRQCRLSSSLRYPSWQYFLLQFPGKYIFRQCSWDQVRERLPGLFYQGGCGSILLVAATVAAGTGNAVFLMVKCPSSPGDSDRAGQQAVIYDNSAAHAGSHGDHNNIGTVFGSALPLLSDDGAVGIIGNAHRKVVMLLQNGFHRGAKPVGDMPCAPGNGSCKGVHLTGGGHTDACKGRGRNAVFLQKRHRYFYHSINDRGLVMVKAHGEKNR